MKTDRSTYLKNILLPCLLFSAITGMATGGLIFLFKLAAARVISLSGHIYQWVAAHPNHLPLLIGGAALLGLVSWLLLKLSPSCRGGGIPTSVALLRGLIDFHWFKSIAVLFASALTTYLGGIPLGTEGPSVQMGTAVGRGTVRLLAHDNRAWDRYIMTGGACAGFAVATGAPLTGIFFAFEEAHRRFSPMIFMVSAMTAISGVTTMKVLCGLCGTSGDMFDFTVDLFLPLTHFWAALVVGIVCGGAAILFTKAYRALRSLLEERLNRVPFLVKLLLIFVAVALIGVVSYDCIGSGHDMIEALIHGHKPWYWLLLYLGIRAVLMIVSNITGVTGGLFIPTLAFGAMLGALSAHGLSALGILPEEYHAMMIVIGMASFLGACSHIPITAITFAVEVLCDFTDILPVVIGVTIAYLVVETVGITPLTEAVIEGKVEAAHRGKRATTVDTHLTLRPGAFAIGKEVRDILWPPTCTVLSVQKSSSAPHGDAALHEGDVLHVHYQTYDPEQSTRVLEAILGKQGISS